jgi:hypothetical protein
VTTRAHARTHVFVGRSDQPCMPPPVARRDIVGGARTRGLRSGARPAGWRARLACSCRATSAGKCAASAQFCREGYYCIISVFWLLAAALLLGLHAWYGIDRQVFVSFPLLQCMSCSLPPLRELQLTCFVSSPSLPRLRELTSPSVTHPTELIVSVSYWSC